MRFARLSALAAWRKPSTFVSGLAGGFVPTMAFVTMTCTGVEVAVPLLSVIWGVTEYVPAETLLQLNPAKIGVEPPVVEARALTVGTDAPISVEFAKNRTVVPPLLLLAAAVSRIF